MDPARDVHIATGDVRAGVGDPHGSLLRPATPRMSTGSDEWLEDNVTSRPYRNLNLDTETKGVIFSVPEATLNACGTAFAEAELAEDAQRSRQVGFAVVTLVLDVVEARDAVEADARRGGVDPGRGIVRSSGFVAAGRQGETGTPTVRNDAAWLPHFLAARFSGAWFLANSTRREKCRWLRCAIS